MGKGEILSGGTDGLYSLKLLMNRERADNTINWLNDQVTHLNDVIIPQLETELSDAETALNAALAALETAITAYNAGEITRDELVAATKVKSEAENVYQLALFSLKENQLKKDTYTKQVEYYGIQAGEDPIVDAWCADLTENLSGIVGTMEIPNERQRPVMIRPGHAGRSIFDSRRDGQLIPVMSMTPAQALYNYMMFPGWQKWMPTYRIGTITKRYVGGRHFVFDVTLDPALSTAQGLNVNESDELHFVPAEYMQTDSMAFEIGDRVIVEFVGQDYRRPKIIGFESNPRKCEAIFYLKIMRDDGKLVDDSLEFEVTEFSFDIENSESVEADSIRADFNDDPQSPTYGYWRVHAVWNLVEEVDPNGYWVFLNYCLHAIPTQYPYRYKSADKRQAADRIAPGIYQMAIPYYSVEEENTLTAAFTSYEDERHKQFIIKSSVPYRLHYWILNDPEPIEEPSLWLLPIFTFHNLSEESESSVQSYIYVCGDSERVLMSSDIHQPEILIKIDGSLFDEVTQFISSLPSYDEYVYKSPHLEPATYSFALSYKHDEIIYDAKGRVIKYHYKFDAHSGDTDPPYEHAVYRVILWLDLDWDY